MAEQLCSYRAAGTGRALPLGMLSSAAITTYTRLLFARAEGLEVDSLGKVWLEDLLAATKLDIVRFLGAVAELAEQGSVLLSRDDMAQRPDALTVGESQLIELA